MASVPSLAGVDLKLWRADDHLEFCFERRLSFISGMLASKTYPIVGQLDEKSGDYVFRVITPLPEPEIGVRVGEFAHVMRSALDNLLWQLILSRGGRPIEGVTQFPIYEDQAKFERKAKAMTRGVAAEDFAIIESVQPYQDRRHPNLALYDEPVREEMATTFARWHPLALLAYLNNVDKHRYLHATIAGGAFRLRHPSGSMETVFHGGRPVGTWAPPGIQLPSPGMSQPVSPNGSVVSSAGFGFAGSDDDPAEVVRVWKVVARRGAKPNMKMEPELLVDVSFSDRERRMPYVELVLIRDAVREIVSRFAPVIGGDPPRTRSVPIGP